MKKFLSVMVVVLFAASTFAAPYLFEASTGIGYWVDVDTTVGTGSNETVLVIDWNSLDNGEDTVSESHAFLYRWDGTAYESDMLTAFNDAGVLIVDGEAFVNNIAYYDADEVSGAHMHIESGSWNLGSSSDPYARWGTWGDSEWDFNMGGTNTELLVDGQFEGINAFLYFGTMPNYADDQLDVPLVPEPATMGLLAIGGLLLRRKRG